MRPRQFWLTVFLLLSSCGLYRTLVVSRLSTTTPSVGGTLVVFGRGFDQDLPLTVTIGEVPIPDDLITGASNTRLELTVPEGTPNGLLEITNASGDVAEYQEPIHVVAELEIDPLEPLPGTRVFPVTVRAKDAAGEPVPGAELLLLTDKGKIDPDPHVVTDANGESRAALDLTGVPDYAELSVVAPPLKAVASYADPGQYRLGTEVVLSDGSMTMPVYLEEGKEGLVTSTLNRRPVGPPVPDPALHAALARAKPETRETRDLIVAYREAAAVSDRLRDDLMASFGLERVTRAGGLDLVRVPPGQTLEEARERLEADPRVAYAEPNRPMHLAASLPNDPQLHKQWGPFAVGAPFAWTLTDGEGVTVAVIDTAIDTEHPELSGALLPGYDFCADESCVVFDDDPHGATDNAAHGTHVAGILAAAPANGTGTAGIAPGVRLVPVKVFADADDQTTFPLNVALAIRWAAGLPVEGLPANPNPARVINLSLGGDESVTVNDAVDDAVAAGAVIVAATGNGHAASVLYPAARPNVIGVGAIEEDWDPAPYSNYGAGLDIVAPGTHVLSTSPGGGTRYMDGTSMATPHVAGAAALVLASDPGLTPEEVKDALLGAAYLPGGADPARFGAGVLRVDGALGLPAPTDDSDRYADLTVDGHETSLDLLTGAGVLTGVTADDLEPPFDVTLQHGSEELSGVFTGW